MDWLKGKGWKTWASGALLVAAGGWMMYNGNVEAGFPVASAGLAAWGLGHKAEKLKAVIDGINKK